MKLTTNLKSFNYLESGEVQFSILDTIKSSKTLDAGVYRIHYENDYKNPRIILHKNENTETVQIYNFDQKDQIETILKGYFDAKVVDKMHSINLYHKLGILLHGKEGCGKTSIMKFIGDKLINERNAVIFHIPSSSLEVIWNFIMDIRKIQSNPIVLIMDEFDRFANMEYAGGNLESLIKQIMDGELSINNTIFLASTNYIDKIPNTIINRPSRFKYVIEVGGIDNVDTIFTIVDRFLNDMYSKSQIKEFSKLLKGKTVDEIKQDCLDKIMHITSHAPKKKKIGFQLQD